MVVADKPYYKDKDHFPFVKKLQRSGLFTLIIFAIKEDRTSQQQAIVRKRDEEDYKYNDSIEHGLTLLALIMSAFLL